MNTMRPLNKPLKQVFQKTNVFNHSMIILIVINKSNETHLKATLIFGWFHGDQQDAKMHT